MTKRSKMSSERQALRLIKDLLLTRRLSLGQKLIYRDLEEMLRMSRTPIITALFHLAQEGLVVYQRNRGYYVKELNENEIQHIYHLRYRLEEISIEYAIKNHSPEDIVLLKLAMDDYIKHTKDIYDFERFKLDVKFHLQIAKMGKNEFLYSILHQFYDNIYILVNVIYLKDHIESFKNDHINLYEQIKAKNLKAAKRIIRIHEQTCNKAIAEVFKTRNSNDARFRKLMR